MPAGVMPGWCNPKETTEMDLSKFKGKTLDDATLSELTAAITTHTEALESRAATAEDKARTAARESIEGRKANDKRIERLSELLGVDTDADLDKIDVKGMADAAKQVEQQLKRVTRERDEAVAAKAELDGKYSAERRDRAIAEAVGKHPFIDAEDARALISGRIAQEGDELRFKGPDGKSLSIDDGVAWMAKTKPHLVRPAGEGSQGSGYKGSSGGKTAGPNPWDKKTFNITQQIALKAENPALAAQLQSAAQAAQPA